MTDDPKSPVEDDITDPKKQDASPDLPAQVEGNDDEDDTEEVADLGEEDTEGEEE
jgi:hypothetical protein